MSITKDFSHQIHAVVWRELMECLRYRGLMMQPAECPAVEGPSSNALRRDQHHPWPSSAKFLRKGRPSWITSPFAGYGRAMLPSQCRAHPPAPPAIELFH